MMVPEICSVEACGLPIRAKGLCSKHYQRNKKYGTPTPHKPTERERFWAKVTKGAPDECWPWTAATRTGYGFFNLETTTIRAHRYAYIDVNGPISPELYVDHMCHVPLCCNPAHLQAVTPQQNNENHSGPTRRSSSGVRGVHWNKVDRRWVGQVSSGGRRYSAGSHSTKEEAARAVLALRNEVHTNNLRDRKAL